MRTTNFHANNQTTVTKVTEEKVLSRIKTFSLSGRLPKTDVEKSEAFAHNKEEKHCVDSSKIPRPQMTASNSFNETLKSNRGRDQTEKTSMIPRSKSRKRNENNKVLFHLPLKLESPKVEVNKTSVLRSEKSRGNFVDQNKKFIFPLKEVNKLSDFSKVENEYSERDLAEKSSLTLKSCQNFFSVQEEESETSYKDAQESMSQSTKMASWREEKVNEFPSQAGDPERSENDEHEAEKQQNTIQNLYDTIKNTMEPLCGNLKWANPKKITISETGILQSDLNTSETIKDSRSKSTHELELNFSSIQDQYEFTLKEISNIWKNAISLISSVKDHTVKFVEENNKSVDKEQLTLEAEMLQLAIDFAISYSKLKMDFLIKSIRKSLNVKELGKSELEAFMDSKTYAAIYSNEDLAAMARTVRDLNLSVLKGEDFDFE